MDDCGDSRVGHGFARLPRQLLIDLSEVVSTDYGTGIHRVVRNLTRTLLQTSDPLEWTCIPVAHSADGGIHSARDFVMERLAAPCAMRDFPPTLGQGDILLLLDSAWENPERFLPSIQRVRAAGGLVGAYVYDLIPIRFPQYCVDFMPAVFEHWLRFVIEHCDFLVCISRSVADDVDAWIGQTNPELGAGLKIGHVHLGSDVDESPEGGAISPLMEQAMHGGRSVLMVGTVEPRKRHDLALAAFEGAWSEGSDLPLVIAGRQGWNVDQLAQRIRFHPELGRKLFWIDKLSDTDLNYAYRHAGCLLQTSDAEGFGLPIVEAARYSVPLLLSNIPVFREIAGNDADYFEAGNVDALRERISPGSAMPAAPASSLAISWRESGQALLNMLGQDAWDHERGGQQAHDHPG